MRLSIFATILFSVTLSAADRRVLNPGNFTPGELKRFYHESVGSELLPLSWLRALRLDGKPLLDQMERFGFISDDAHSEKLPIGISLTASREYDRRGQYVGLTCAACHVNEVLLSEQRFIVLGGANQFDLDGFFHSLNDALTAQTKDKFHMLLFIINVLAEEKNAPQLGSSGLETNLEKFLPEVLKKRERILLEKLERLDDPKQNALVEQFAESLVELSEKYRKTTYSANGFKRKLELAAELAAPPEDASASSGEFVKNLSLKAEQVLKRAAYIRHLAQTTAERTSGGYGRADVLGLARNVVFPDQGSSLTAPVAIPALWRMPKKDWVTCAGNSNASFDAILGHMLGLGVQLDAESGESTANMGGLRATQALVARIEAPAWPAQILELNKKRLLKGMEIYKRLQCAACHAAVSSALSAKASNEAATDVERLEIFNRQLNDKAYPAVLTQMLKLARDRAFAAEGIGEDLQAVWLRSVNDSAPEWRATTRYEVRSLAGIWAAAPYLHNGSVRSLYDLFLPTKIGAANARKEKFYVGGRTYELDKLGYKEEGVNHQLRDASFKGNYNTGHEGARFGTELDEEERLSLIEYLKAL